MILFFDTESTGLPKNYKAPVTDLDNGGVCPHKDHYQKEKQYDQRKHSSK